MSAVRTPRPAGDRQAPPGRGAVGRRVLGPCAPPRRPDPPACSTPCPCTGTSPPSPDADAGASAVAPVLRERLASAGDSLLAMGCTGACQPVLGLEELDREIAWGLRNPWSTGLADVFGRRPAAAVPRLADLDRPGRGRAVPPARPRRWSAPRPTTGRSPSRGTTACGCSPTRGFRPQARAARRWMPISAA